MAISRAHMTAFGIDWLGGAWPTWAPFMPLERKLPNDFSAHHHKSAIRGDTRQEQVGRWSGLATSEVGQAVFADWADFEASAYSKSNV